MLERKTLKLSNSRSNRYNKPITILLIELVTPQLHNNIQYSRLQPTACLQYHRYLSAEADQRLNNDPHQAVAAVVAAAGSSEVNNGHRYKDVMHNPVAALRKADQLAVVAAVDKSRRDRHRHPAVTLQHRRELILALK